MRKEYEEMAYFGNIGTNNQGMINQLMRQKENIEKMYAKFSKAFISDIDAKKDKVYDSIVK